MINVAHPINITRSYVLKPTITPDVYSGFCRFRRGIFHWPCLVELGLERLLQQCRCIVPIVRISGPTVNHFRRAWDYVRLVVCAVTVVSGTVT
mgnify:CR=1 FL=1